ncbi:hypothetical protein QFZ98_004555 [Paraburkholderia youngii]
MLEVSPDAFGLHLNDQIMVHGGLGQLQPGTRWRPAGDALLEVSVGHLVGIQLGFVRMGTSSRTMDATMHF